MQSSSVEHSSWHCAVPDSTQPTIEEAAVTKPKTAIAKRSNFLNMLYLPIAVRPPIGSGLRLATTISLVNMGSAGALCPRPATSCRSQAASSVVRNACRRRVAGSQFFRTLIKILPRRSQGLRRRLGLRRSSPFFRPTRRASPSTSSIRLAPSSRLGSLRAPRPASSSSTTSPRASLAARSSSAPTPRGLRSASATASASARIRDRAERAAGPRWVRAVARMAERDSFPLHKT